MWTRVRAPCDARRARGIARPSHSRNRARMRFAFADTEEQLADFEAAFPAATADARGLGFAAQTASGTARLTLPATVDGPIPGESIADFRARASLLPLRRVVVLLQYGAMAMGYWDGEALVRHKAEKRYVVRGNGTAQVTHLRTKGKSRYGSRLRLQNWELLLRDVTERLVAWREELPEPERVFLAMTPRAASALWSIDPAPPFARDDARIRRVPRHVHVPDHAELLAVDRWLSSGELTMP